MRGHRSRLDRGDLLPQPVLGTRVLPLRLLQARPLTLTLTPIPTPNPTRTNPEPRPDPHPNLSGHRRCAPGSYGADCSLPPRPPPRAAAGPAEAAAPLRPLIYVYELPGESNTFLLARRQNADA